MSFDTAEDWLSHVRNDLTEQKRISRVIAITGGKGGVGKSTLSLKFAFTLADQGYKVLLVDSDVNLSNLAVKLSEPLTDHFFDLISSKLEFSSCLIHRHNLDILPGCNGNIDLFKGELTLDKIIIDIIEEHKKEYDFILIDSPAGLSKLTLNIAAYSDDRFVVVNPDRSSMTDAYSLMKLLVNNYETKNFHLVVNRVSSAQEYYKVVRGLGETIDRFLHARLNILGSIPQFNISSDQFDKQIFARENNSFTKDFLHITHKYAEEHSRKDTVPLSWVQKSNTNYGQEVHHVC